MRDLPLLGERRGISRPACDSLLRDRIDEEDDHDLVVVLYLERLAMQSRGSRWRRVELLPGAIDPSGIDLTRQ